MHDDREILTDQCRGDRGESVWSEHFGCSSRRDRRDGRVINDGVREPGIRGFRGAAMSRGDTVRHPLHAFADCLPRFLIKAPHGAFKVGAARGDVPAGA